MLNKRIKSVLIAGIVILGMGFTKVDSFAAESKSVNVDYTQIELNPYGTDYEKDGITIDVDRIDGLAILDEDNNQIGTYDANSYGVIITWDKDKVSYNGAGIITTEEIEIENFNVKDGRASLNITLRPGVSIKSVAFGYDLIDNNEEEAEKTQESYVESIINKYKENMVSLGKVSDDGSFRYIDKSYGINENDWNDFLTNFNDKTNKNNGMRIEYDKNEKVYVVIENINNTIVERIQIEFIDTLDKGWIPEITPGTGQALAVGGIVIGAVAAVGLLVNNRKRKDEE